jgi:hypothetical protein
VDLLRQAHLAPMPITITGGETVISEAEHRSRGPKWNLVSSMQALVQTGRLKVAAALPEAAILAQERLALQVKMTPHGHDTSVA